MIKLKYYINLGAPPIRDYADSDELFMRPEVGFNPSWFHKYCGIDFSEKWHTDVEYRLQCHEKMTEEIKKHFPGYNIGEVLEDKPLDLLTGIFGIGIIDSILGRELRYFDDKWPVPFGEDMSDEQISSLEVPDLNNNRFFQSILEQLDRIKELTGSSRGFLNWQGNLNTAFRLRGNEIFSDLIMKPYLANKLFEIISDIYLQGVKLLHKKQNELGVNYEFATIANCTVNMVGPELYEQFLLKYDSKIASQFKIIGVHNCAWTVTPYLVPYSKISNVGYIDMGIDSDMTKAKELFPKAKRNCLYTSMDLKNKSQEVIRKDFEFIAKNLAPCDLGMPDIEMDVPDIKIMYAIDLCRELSEST
ncbi:uroporphyrinogen decarboxylase family protein [Bacteroidota bacterium]